MLKGTFSKIEVLENFGKLCQCGYLTIIKGVPYWIISKPSEIKYLISLLNGKLKIRAKEFKGLCSLFGVPFLRVSYIVTSIRYFLGIVDNVGWLSLTGKKEKDGTYSSAKLGFRLHLYNLKNTLDFTPIINLSISGGSYSLFSSKESFMLLKEICSNSYLFSNVGLLHKLNLLGKFYEFLDLSRWKNLTETIGLQWSCFIIDWYSVKWWYSAKRKEGLFNYPFFRFHFYNLASSPNFRFFINTFYQI